MPVRRIIPIVMYVSNVRYFIGEADLDRDPQVAVLFPGAQFASRIAHIIGVTVGDPIYFRLPDSMTNLREIELTPFTSSGKTTLEEWFVNPGSG
jgi:hypothetical protein